MEMIESNSPVGPVFTLTLDNGVSHTAMTTAALAPEMTSVQISQPVLCGC